MSKNVRFLGREPQGIDERVAYQIDTALIGTPTAPSVVAKARAGGSTWVDVTSTVFPTNTPGVSGTVITLSLLRNLTQDVLYRIEIQYTIGGNLFENIIEILAEL